jgi:hypothetical protein
VASDAGTNWERGWDGHCEAQLRRLAKLPLTEKLKWLEQAHRVVKHMARRASDRGGGTGEVADAPIEKRRAGG